MEVLEGMYLDGRIYHDFVIPGRSVDEVFSGRMVEGSSELAVSWTASLGKGTLVNRIGKVQDLVGGPGKITRITGQASAEFRDLIRTGSFDLREMAELLDQRLGGKWRVELQPRAGSVPPTWDVVANRVRE
jgi:hypothetical protein